MASHVGFLRGVNVGGRNKLAMADLRAVVADLGNRDVSTYIQSGNVLFTPTEPKAPAAIAAKIARELRSRLDLTVPVVVLDKGGLDAILAANPFVPVEDPKAVHVVFLDEPASPDAEAAVAEAIRRARGRGSSDDARLVGSALYLSTPGGFGRSVLVAELGRASTTGARPPVGTARNWASAVAISRLLG